MCSKLQKYVDSPNNSRHQAYWPIVKAVRCRGPWNALFPGLILIDVPGTGDDNAARNAVVQRYYKEVWLQCAPRHAPWHNAAQSSRLIASITLSPSD